MITGHVTWCKCQKSSCKTTTDTTKPGAGAAALSKRKAFYVYRRCLQETPFHGRQRSLSKIADIYMLKSTSVIAGHVTWCKCQKSSCKTTTDTTKPGAGAAALSKRKAFYVYRRCLQETPFHGRQRSLSKIADIYMLKSTSVIAGHVTWCKCQKSSCKTTTDTTKPGAGAAAL